MEDEDEQRSVILAYHQDKTSHVGIKETLLKIKQNYFWRNMEVTIAKIINSCERCNKLKYDHKPPKPMLKLNEIPLPILNRKNNRDTKITNKNIKRPPRVRARASSPDYPDPGPSTSKN